MCLTPQKNDVVSRTLEMCVMQLESVTKHISKIQKEDQ